MKISSAIIQLFSAAFVVVLLVFFSACSEEHVIPVPGENNKEPHITIRSEASANGGSDNGGSDNGGSDNGGSDNGGSDNGGSDNGGSVNEGPVNPELIKIKVSQRDNIPLAEIETCIYYGQTILGFWEYRLTTLYSGLKIYTVTQIIGDDFDGA